MNSALLKVTQARSGLLLDNPFFGALSIKLKLQEDETAETMWTDGETIGYNPDFVNMLKTYELKTVFAHEVLHVALNHNTRRGNRDGKQWNKACDYAVNAMLKDSGFEIPAGGLYRPDFKGKTAEQIFTALGDDKGNNGQSKPEQGKEQGGKGKSKAELLAGAGEVRDFKGTEQGKTQQEQKQQIDTTQAANLAEKAGDLAGSLKEFVKALNEPKVDWKEVLNRFVTQQVKNDYSFKRINARYLSTGFCLPTLYNNQLAPILLAVDTSGSINDSDKKQFATEIEDIILTYNVTVEVVYCDTKIRTVETFTTDDLPLAMNYKGGGGTKFSPVMDYIEKMEEAPCCLIYLTDLECNDFGAEKVETLWIQTRGNIRKDVPFGEVVLLK